jgi:hypothetical protein
MKQRCPHCQTTPLRADAQTCWYCGKDYAAKPRLPRSTRGFARSTASRRRSEPRATANTAR